MAEQYENASWVNRINYWNNQATARVNGNASIVPGTVVPIQVSGIAGRTGTNDHDGTWLVRGVNHVLTHNSFQTELDLARDTTTLPINVITRNFWEPKYNNGTPKMNWDYEHKRWTSSWSQVEYVSETLVTDTPVNGNITASTAVDMIPVK
jgi:hypothetical protein